MSGDDLCEQPILQPAELRALVGLTGMAVVLFLGVRALSPLATTGGLPAAAAVPIDTPTPVTAPYQEPPLEWTPVTAPQGTGTTTATESLLPLVTEIN